MAVAIVVGRVEDRLGIMLEELMEEEGRMEVEGGRMMEVDIEEAMAVVTGVDEAVAATTATTGMRGDQSSDKEVEDTKEISRASRPMAIKGAHEAVATTTEVEVASAEAAEASTEALVVEITSLLSQAPLSLPFPKIQKMPNLKNAASSPTSSR